MFGDGPTLVPVPSEGLAVIGDGATSMTFGAAMQAGQFYAFSSSSDAWISQGDTPTASRTSGSAFVPAAATVILDGAGGADLACLTESSDASCSLTRCLAVR
jgi:hypothetical protein